MGEGQELEYKGWQLRVRVPEKKEGTLRVMFLIHGLMGDENVMWIFLPRLPKDVLIIAPRALYPVESGGYTWQKTVRTRLPGAEDLRPAANALLELMDELNQQPPELWRSGQADFHQVDLLGFSQGSALSYLFALLYPERVRKLGGLAGFMPRGVDALVQREPLAGKKAFVAHGTKDDIVPVVEAEEAVRLLEQAGGEVSFCLDDVGHKLSLDCFKGLGEFFRSA
jgi:phospholipase/carboxylesterase